jgi:uncharacterized protein (DUF362 family)
MSENIITKTKSTANLRLDIQRLLQPLGSLAQFIKPGESVLIKPNFNTADPSPASTAPDFLETIVQLVKLCGASRIIIGDSCTITQNTETVMTRLGIFELGKRLGVEIMNFDKTKFITKKINGRYLKSVKVPAILDQVNKIITLPCLKVHRFAGFTMSLKICVGFMKKLTRIKLHTGGHLEKKIAELNLTYKPTLIILDGRKAFITHGPESGEVVEPNMFLAGTDRVALDIEALKILTSYQAKNELKQPVAELPMIKRAVELCLDTADENNYSVIEI